MITPKQAQESTPDCRETLKTIEKEMDERIKMAHYTGHDSAFIIVEDYPEHVRDAIRKDLVPKYTAAGWAGATCHRRQHFMVHFTKSSLQEYDGYAAKKK